MNQFYNTRNPVDLWLNVGSFKKSFTYLCYPLGQLFNNCLTGAKIWQSKARSASLRGFFASKIDVSGQSSLLHRFRPPGVK